MNKKIILSFVSGAVLLAAVAAQAAVTGRVVNAGGAPVADAMVGYTTVANRLIYAYTCADGRFALQAPAEWNLKDLKMYDCNTPIQQKNIKTSSLKNTPLNLSAEMNTIRFNVSGTQKITISLFAPNGRKIQTVFDNRLTEGIYQVNPLSYVKRALSHQVYIVQVSNGSITQSVTMISAGQGKSGTIGKADNAGYNAGLAKILAIDSIRAGKTGFTAAKKGIDAYSGDIGDITITARDIESEITAIMNGKTTQWKANQVTQGIDYNNSSNWGTMFYGVGNGGAYTARADQTDGWQAATMTAVGVPKMIGIDAVHGFISPPAGTVFPHNIGLGCTRIPNLCELVERVTAIELRAMGVNWSFAPVMDVVRNERHGRTYESWDEGPDGYAPMAKAAVRGFQGTDLSCDLVCAATAKHYAGAGGTNDGTHGGNAATGTDAVLRAIHLPHYKICVDNGAATVMAAFNSWLGTPMHNHSNLLTTTLKGTYGFTGFVVGDWMASQGVGLLNSFNAGVDNMMNPENPTAAYNAVVGAPAARLDDACRRVLRVKLWMNLTAPNNYLAKRYLLPTIASAEHKAVARECVRRSMVLLKNEGNVLPIAANKNVHVIGDHANSMSLQCGGWTLGWPTGATATTPPGVNIRTAIDNACSGTVTWAANGNGIPANADVVVVVFGEQPYAEGGGDAPGNQPIDYDGSSNTNCANYRAMITAAKNSGKSVVGLLVTGRPLIVTTQIANCNAFMCAWLPGTEGDGVADILFRVNGEKPTGKLSHTWPASYGQIPINTGSYGDAVGSGGTPLFAYGFGLTY